MVMVALFRTAWVATLGIAFVASRPSQSVELLCQYAGCAHWQRD